MWKQWLPWQWPLRTCHPWWYAGGPGRWAKPLKATSGLSNPPVSQKAQRHPRRAAPYLVLVLGRTQHRPPPLSAREGTTPRPQHPAVTPGLRREGGRPALTPVQGATAPRLHQPEVTWTPISTQTGISLRPETGQPAPQLAHVYAGGGSRSRPCLGQRWDHFIRRAAARNCRRLWRG